MKKSALFLLFVSFHLVGLSQNDLRIDTLYFNRSRQGVPNPAFADYYKIFVADSTSRQPFRDFFMTGELKAEGYLLRLDPRNDANTVIDGEWTEYFQSGQIARKGFNLCGKREGEYTEYYPNGLIKTHAFYADDKKHGICTEFSKEGDRCIQIEYRNGDPKYDYYTVSNKDGHVSKCRISDDMPIWETPSLSEQQTRYENGEAWYYYIKNGLLVSLSLCPVKDYGKYYRAKIVLANNSIVPIEFDASIISAFTTDKNGDLAPLEVYSTEEYLKKVKRRQNWNAALYAVGEGLSAASAGYSASTSHTNIYNEGFSHVTSSTHSYNGLAAYQANVIASDRIANYSSRLFSEYKAREEGYLKRTTVFPGEMISGYVHVQRIAKSDGICVTIDLFGARYTFPWNITAETIDRQRKANELPGIEDSAEDYAIVGSSVHGMTPVMQDGKYGFINENLELAIPCIYDKVGSFNTKGLAKVWIGDETFYIRKEGPRVEK